MGEDIRAEGKIQAGRLSRINLPWARNRGTFDRYTKGREEKRALIAQTAAQRELKPKYTEFNVDFYSLRIDRANLPEDEVGGGGVLHPDTLMFRLNHDLLQIPGAVSLSHENLVTLLIAQEDAAKKGQYYDSVERAYLLRGYEPPIYVHLTKQDFLPAENYAKGCSDIHLGASYAGPKDMTITSIKTIADKHGLEQRRLV